MGKSKDTHDMSKGSRKAKKPSARDLRRAAARNQEEEGAAPSASVAGDEHGAEDCEINNPLVDHPSQANVPSFLALQFGSSDKSARDKSVRVLRRFFSSRSEWGESELLKLWRGLFYCFWHSDKPLIQLELAASIADLADAFTQTGDRFSYIKAGLVTIIREWGGIDRLRLDKFYSLLRLMLRKLLSILAESFWAFEQVEEVLELLGQTTLKIDSSVPLGVFYHIADIMVEELKHVTSGDLTSIPPSIIMQLTRPFLNLIATNRLPNPIISVRLRNGIVQDLFDSISEIQIELPEDASEVEVQMMLKSTQIRQFLILNQFSKALFVLAAANSTVETHRNLLYNTYELFHGAVDALLEENPELQDELPDDSYLQQNGSDSSGVWSDEEEITFTPRADRLYRKSALRAKLQMEEGPSHSEDSDESEDPDFPSDAEEESDEDDLEPLSDEDLISQLEEPEDLPQETAKPPSKKASKKSKPQASPAPSSSSSNGVSKPIKHTPDGKNDAANPSSSHKKQVLFDLKRNTYQTVAEFRRGRPVVPDLDLQPASPVLKKTSYTPVPVRSKRSSLYGGRSSSVSPSSKQQRR
ncbi:MAG: RRP1 family protein [archaeon]|nr:RRP1 family protein [archaeon]